MIFHHISIGIIALVIGVLYGGLACPSSAAAKELLIIANKSVISQHLNREDLAYIFLLKRTRWPNGDPIIPVNRQASSKERSIFSERVLGRSARSLANYWNKMRFKGFRPPVIQESGRAVIAFVGHVPDAIGYVYSHATSLPAGVSIIMRIPL